MKDHPPRKPLPMSREDAKHIFGIDSTVLLPRIGFSPAVVADPADRDRQIWHVIVPAAFSWYHYFKTTKVHKWGLDASGYEFEDCIAAIRNAMVSIGCPPDEVSRVIDGALYAAYLKYKPGRNTPYVPNATCPGRVPKTTRIRDLARRRFRNFLKPKKPRRHRESKFDIKTWDDVEALYAAGKISAQYRSRLRRRLVIVDNDPWLVGLRGYIK